MWIIFIIQKVQDTVIHVEVDEEQWVSGKSCVETTSSRTRFDL